MIGYFVSKKEKLKEKCCREFDFQPSNSWIHWKIFFPQSSIQFEFGNFNLRNWDKMASDKGKQPVIINIEKKFH